MTERGNLFDSIPAQLPVELEELLTEGRSFRLKRIVSKGHQTDWYIQTENEWVVLLKGAAQLEFADKTLIDLTPGDFLLIPTHCKHRVSWTDPQADSVWLALYFD